MKELRNKSAAVLSRQFNSATRLVEYLEDNNIPFFAKDNIYNALVSLGKQVGMTPEEYRQELVDEATIAFEYVLHTLAIDVENDPNSRETPHRLAKMYINEMLEGRYVAAPKVTAFPNEKVGDGKYVESKQMSGDMYHFNNLLVVQSPFTSVCSHHHAPVTGTAYIGIIPGEKVIGLSKYTRLVQYMATRGTLQEELTTAIADIISEKSQSEDIAVVVYGRHGCCENRGVRVPNSQTATAEMRGLFMLDGKLREEFYDHVKMMRREK